MTRLINNWVSNTTGAANGAGTGHPSGAQELSGFHVECLLPNSQCISLSTIDCRFINLALTIALFVFFLYLRQFIESLLSSIFPYVISTDLYLLYLTFTWCNWHLNVRSDLYLLELTFTWCNWHLNVRSDIYLLERTDIYVMQLTFPHS